MDKTTYTYKTVESGQSLEADVYYCPQNSSPASPAPIALMIHGGGFTAGGKESIAANQLEELVALGFVVVSVNYRLCPTISLADGPLADCNDCYAWCQSSLPDLLEREPGVAADPARIVALGHSAGGYLALMMVRPNWNPSRASSPAYDPLHQARNPNPPVAILDFYGAKYLSDDVWHRPNPQMPRLNFAQEVLDQIWLEVPPPSTSILAQSDIPAPQSGLDFTRPRIAWLASALANGTLLQHIIRPGDYTGLDPSTYFKAGFPPVFFIHGTADKLIPFQLTEKSYYALRQCEVETVLRLVDGADHAFDEKVHRDDPAFGVIKEGFRFLAHHAKLL
ncbi:Alpha/Beta hydrolase protein [Aspergillus pseudodeflectus]|uniref:Alpha/Beta hydrolase protein n=1 Tax=Aspergillus pseudodeflectus TaxID=176178 RepID=A0ABR4JHA4_9EURO